MISVSGKHDGVLVAVALNYILMTLHFSFKLVIFY